MIYKIRPWMYRTGGENVILILTLLIATAIAFLFVQLDFWFGFVVLATIITLVRLEQAKYLEMLFESRRSSFQTYFAQAL